MKRFVDPRHAARAEYDRELAELRAARGEPASRQERREFRREVRRLKRKHLGFGQWMANW